METLARPHPPSHNHHTHRSQPLSAMPVPVPVPKPEPASEPIVAGSKPHLLYKCLLSQHAQKMRKLPPIYQTQNEGSDHLPKFRSTVSFDGVSYTSSNTFPHLKMAEMDVSKTAYIAMIQKSKSEALRHIQEDKSFCKSIMVEYAAKMNIERPKYVTSQQGAVIPVFRSHLSFNGATFPGDIGKSKKEAEQLVARAVILKYLDSEFANDMVKVINCKFRHAAEMSKVQEINNVYNGTNVVVTQPCIPEVPTEPTTPATPVVTQPRIPKVLTKPISPAPPVVTQPRMTEPITPATPVVTQPCIPKVLTKPITPATPVVTQPRIPKTEPITPTAPVVTQPRIPKVLTGPITPAATMVTQPRIPKVSIESVTKTVPVVTQPRPEGIRPAVRRPVVLAHTPSAQVNTLASASRSGQLASNPSLDRSVEHKPLKFQTPGRKRHWENNKNAQKKMCDDAQRPIPGMHASPAQPFRSQISRSKGNNSRMPHQNASWH